MRVTLDFPAAEEILQEVGLDEQGDAQMFHTKNVLRRVQKYMPYRTGATIKLTVAQTDPRVPEIVTEEPQAVYLYNDVSRSGKPLNYTKTKNPLEVTVPDEDGDYTFTAYFSNVGDELLRKKAEKNYWKNLTANFIAQKPART